MPDWEAKLNERVGAEFGVAPSEVNCDLFHRWRREHPFPIEKYETESIYGGYNVHHLPTEDELRAIRESGDAFLDQYSEGAKT